MSKCCIDLRVVSVEHLNVKYALLKLTHEQKLPPMLPGQFVEIRIDGSATTFLRRPISVHYVDTQANQLWLLVAAVGEGTRWLASLCPGQTLNCVLPLGRGFTLPTHSSERFLLVGGGVGIAPLLFLGEVIRQQGGEPTFLLGARTAADVLQLSEFELRGRVFITTEDGSMGEKGFVTNHSVLGREQFSMISVCGPKPMMQAMARYAKKVGTECEVSLENMMACGLGACLCCVEKTVDGNLCVCKEGPVFNIKRLLWQD